MTESTPAQTGVPTCYRHPGRETYISCQRCGRPICPDCMTSAAVGFQCPECVKQGARDTRQGLTPYGGQRVANPGLTSMILIGINAAVWVAIFLTGWGASPLLRELALRPVSVSVGGAWWQPLTVAFTHVQLIHIGFNMLALWVLGPQVELAFGRARFLGLYFGSTLAASATIMLLSSPLGWTVGASGAVFGLLAALLVMAIKVRGNVQSIAMWVGLNVAFTVFGAGAISWQGHLGGFVGGLAIALGVIYAPKGPSRATLQWLAIAAVTVGSLAVIALRAATLSL